MHSLALSLFFTRHPSSSSLNPCPSGTATQSSWSWPVAPTMWRAGSDAPVDFHIFVTYVCFHLCLLYLFCFLHHVHHWLYCIAMSTSYHIVFGHSCCCHEHHVHCNSFSSSSSPPTKHCMITFFPSFFSIYLGYLFSLPPLMFILSLYLIHHACTFSVKLHLY